MGDDNKDDAMEQMRKMFEDMGMNTEPTDRKAEEAEKLKKMKDDYDRMMKEKAEEDEMKKQGEVFDTDSDIPLGPEPPDTHEQEPMRGIGNMMGNFRDEVDKLFTKPPAPIEPEKTRIIDTIKSLHPRRDKVIQQDEITDLTIDLQSTETVNDFLKKLGIKVNE